MKKIFVFMIMMPVLASCILEYSDVRIVNENVLMHYAETRRYEIVDIPLELLETAIEFDAYLSLPDDQKQASSMFFGNYKEVEDNMYSISIYDKRASASMMMEVYTGGKSIWAEKAVWRVNGFHYDGRYLDGVPEEDDDVLEDGMELALVSSADSTWTLKIGERAAVKMKMHPMNEGLYTWTVNAEGEEYGEVAEDLASEFGTVGSFIVRERSDAESQYVYNFYDGQFNVSIFKDGEPHDYCYVTYKYDQQPVYKTSR